MKEQLTGNSQISITSPTEGFKYFPFFNARQPFFILLLIGLIFYCVTVNNEYALDDGIIIHQNEYVLKGIAGVKDLVTKDLYDSFYKRMNASDQLEGGRYRPLTTVTYALEQEFIGTYRSGFYNRADDLNNNGKLDGEPVTYISGKNRYTNYEYNSFIDLSGDKEAQANECYPCWDLNKNFRNDTNEDINKDGVMNEVDCQTYRAWFRHFNNIWLYLLSVVLVYILFREYMLRDHPDIAFLAALLFLTHPVHSEVVANIKGRDEILSVIFIALTFIFSFKFLENKKWITLFTGALVFFLALLSKEYALLLPLLVPVAIHVFTKNTLRLFKFLILTAVFILLALTLIYIKTCGRFNDIPLWIPVITAPVIFLACFGLFFRSSSGKGDPLVLMCVLFATALLYIGIRVTAVGLSPGVPDTELLNNPFLLASGEQAFATKVFVMLNYLRLAVFPNTLVSDYSFNSIEYRSFSSWDFILSVIINLTFLIAGIRYVIRRHVMGFAILTYYIFLIPVCNFFFASGTVMLETYLFHASIGISTAFAWLIMKGLQRLPNISFKIRRSMLLTMLTVIIVLFACKTIERNKDWKSDITLFLKDVHNAPNSVLVLGNAGARWIDLADTKEITGIALPGEDLSVSNDYNGQLKIMDEELLAGGYLDKREAALNKGIAYLKRAVELHPGYVNAYLNLGLAFFKLNKEYEAIYYWKMAEQLYPDNPYLRNYYMVYNNILSKKGSAAFNEKKYHDALKEYNKCIILDSKNAESWFHLGGCYYQLHNLVRAKECWEKALKLKPDYEEVKQLLKSKV